MFISDILCAQVQEEKPMAESLKKKRWLMENI